LLSGECFFSATKVAKSEQVAAYFAELACLYEMGGYEQVDIFLDGNPTHKQKMQLIFATLTPDLKVKVNFHIMAPYSPALNLVEYAIHLIRQKILHHADCKSNLAQLETHIKELCDNLLSKEQIINILEHIESLVPNL
jgi:hypothetical protein